jgi:dolichol-phosphate mannosyltransferase
MTLSPLGSQRGRSMTFIVTALNEQDNIRQAVATVIDAAADFFSEYEILLVNDGSTDGTGVIMDAMASENPRLRVLHNKRNLGLGGAYRRAIREAKNEFLMWIPGDNGEQVDDIRRILQCVGQADIVAPYPIHYKRPFLRTVASRAFVMITNALFGLRLRYFNGLVVHRTSLINSVEIETSSFAYQAEALIKLLKAGCSYVEVGYTSAPQLAANTKALRLQNILGVVGTLARLAWQRPWRNFGVEVNVEAVRVKSSAIQNSDSKPSAPPGGNVTDDVCSR